MIKRLLGLLQTDHFKASPSADQDMNCGEQGGTENSGIFFLRLHFGHTFRSASAADT